MGIKITGSEVLESKTEQNAKNNVIIFDREIVAVDVYHSAGEQKDFQINGMIIRIGPGGWRSLVGGKLSARVVIPDNIECTINRLE